ncbi:MAG: response regulator [Candidatus Omnitrophica bacterium]|nr:response regulator [Candidatus Omnitrophota bacterium]
MVSVAQERIFIIDDDTDFLELCTKRLEHVGYQVRSFENASDAIKAIRNEKPDLVISDIKMPGLNGLEVCDLLRSNSFTKYIPMILMTGYVDKKAYVESLDAKPLFFVAKPFGAKDFLETVRTAIDSPFHLEEHFSKS